MELETRLSFLLRFVNLIPNWVSNESASKEAVLNIKNQDQLQSVRGGIKNTITLLIKGSPLHKNYGWHEITKWIFLKSNFIYLEFIGLKPLKTFSNNFDNFNYARGFHYFFDLKKFPRV